jgi:hypothetical protein
MVIYLPMPPEATSFIFCSPEFCNGTVTIEPDPQTLSKPFKDALAICARPHLPIKLVLPKMTAEEEELLEQRTQEAKTAAE